jgi:hypothetical protein
MEHVMSTSIYFHLPKARPWLPLPLRGTSLYEDISEGRVRAKWMPRDGTWGPKRTLAIDEDEISRILQEEGERLNAALADHRARCAAFQRAVATARESGNGISKD